MENFSIQRFSVPVLRVVARGVVLILAVVRKIFRKRSDEPFSRILLVNRRFGLGDTLLMRPFVFALRRQFPEHEIVLFAQHGGTNSAYCLLEIDPPDAEEPAEKSFDRIYDLTLNERPDLLWKLLFIPCRTLSGLAIGTKRFFFDEAASVSPADHAVDRWLAMLPEKPLDGETTAALKNSSRLAEELPLPAGRKVVMDPFSGFVNGRHGEPAKCWGAENFLACARLLHQQGIQPILAGLAEAEPMLRAIDPDFEDYTFSLIGKTSIGELVGAVQQSDVVLCNNSGLLHLAVALQKPSVSFAGNVNLQLWGAYQNDGRHSIISFESPEAVTGRVLKLFDKSQSGDEPAAESAGQLPG